MKIADLHTHTNVSDGSHTPSALAALAKEKNLAAFALTDHDTIAGVDEAAQAARRLGVRFLPGMEMSVRYGERQLHIVALGFDAADAAFVRMYRKLRGFKERGMPELIERIRRAGADISLEKVAPFVRGAALDRYAIMRYFVSLRLFDDVQKIWDTFINPALLGYNETIAADEAIAAVKAAGGVTSLAHFHKRLGLLGLDRVAQETVLYELHSLGMDGMELYYPNYSPEDRQFAAAMIEKYQMLPTGGTDFHGVNRPAIALGTGLPDSSVTPYTLFEDVAERCRVVL